MPFLIAAILIQFYAFPGHAQTHQSRSAIFRCECLVENAGGLNQRVGIAYGPGLLIFSQENGVSVTTPDVDREAICAKRFGYGKAYTGVCATPEQMKRRNQVIEQGNAEYSDGPAHLGGLQRPQKRPVTASDIVIDTFNGNRQRPPSTLDPSWYNFCKIRKCGPGQARGR
jgi:hypothetical protein